MDRYDWSPGNLEDGIFEASLSQGSEYVPMIWGEGDLTQDRLEKLEWVGDSSKFLLGFNEPNYEHQVTAMHHGETTAVYEKGAPV